MILDINIIMKHIVEDGGEGQELFDELRMLIIKNIKNVI